MLHHSIDVVSIDLHQSLYTTSAYINLRQFNLLTILVGAAPDGNPDKDYNEAYVSRMARINSLAGDEFNRGLRSYYFGIASVTWMIHPGLLMAFSALIVFVLIRRDFYSEALEIMSR